MSTPSPDPALLPVSFEDARPTPGAAAYLADPAVRHLAAFFRAKGLAALKQEDRQEDWYQDWIDEQARHGIYASLLSPEALSSRGHRFDVRRLTRFLECAAYFSPAHAYSLHVSFLGIFPILTGDNEGLKREAVAKLEAGGLFAFGVSEKAHGSDLFSNEFTVRSCGADRWVADGSKYYIGNANAAAMVSVLARSQDESPGGVGRRSPFLFLALRPAEAPGFGPARKIRTIGVRAAFVGEFEVRGHEFGSADVISSGRAAWDAMFHTVDFGKFFLGFGAIGICEHAFAEALDHLRGRTLYGAPVTDLPHIRAAATAAYARLVAMKFHAVRALDYLQAAGPDERRYLLFTAVQKARVSTEGVKVIALLSECIGARGTEAETYFESAMRDAQLIPGLEGSTHINYGQVAQYVRPYFATPAGRAAPPPPPMPDDAPENPHWFRPPNRNAKRVRFAPPYGAYATLQSLPNVSLFVRQVEAFDAFAAQTASHDDVWTDARVRIAVGRCFAIIAQAQLVAECAVHAAVAPSTVSVLFHALVGDLAHESLELAALLPATHPARALLAQLVLVPETDPAHFEALWHHIEAHDLSASAPSS